MRQTFSLLIYLLVVFIGGALLAPCLFWLAKAAAQGAQPGSGGFIAHLAENPFHRFVNRSLIIVALAGMWPLMKSLGARSWQDVGLVSPSGQFGRVGQGLLLGFGSLACVAVLALLFHARTFNGSIAPGRLAGKLIGAALTALTVAVIEEILFRGAVFGALKRAWSRTGALLLSSMIYAIVHFMQSADPAGPITWSTGLELLPQMLRGFGNIEAVVPGFFNLTLAGILLALAYDRTRNLYFSIGLHAGWIFWLKSYGMLTAEVPNSSAWIFGTSKLIDGWLSLVVLTICMDILLKMTAQKQDRKDS